MFSSVKKDSEDMSFCCAVVVIICSAALRKDGLAAELVQFVKPCLDFGFVAALGVKVHHSLQRS